MTDGITYKNSFIAFEKLLSFIKNLKFETLTDWERDLFSFMKAFLVGEETFSVQTSGSTGTPKKFNVERNDLILSAKLTNQYLNLDTSTTAVDCLPSQFIAGKMMFVRAFEGKYNLLIAEPQANPLTEIPLPIDFIAITPYQAEQILKNSITNERLQKTKNVIIGGSAPSPLLKEKFLNWKNKVYSTYGMTETLSHVAMAKLNSENPDDFYPVSDVFEFGQDKRNCLTITSPYKHDSFIVSNDIVSFNDDGSFEWIGRADNVINSGGIKHNPEVIEGKLNQLISHPFIVSSKDHDELGDSLILVIESENKDYLKESFKVAMAEVLDKYEMPKEIFCIQAFNRLDNDKIDRRKIPL